MDIISSCTSEKGKTACMTGLVLGILITLLLVWLYMTYVSGSAAASTTTTTASSEWFTDPNAMDPQTAALLLSKNAADPTSGTALKKMYGARGY